MVTENLSKHRWKCRHVGVTRLVGGIELESRPGQPGARAFDAVLRCFDKGVLIRTSGDIIALSPPLIISESQIDEMFSDKLPKMLDAVA